MFDIQRFADTLKSSLELQAVLAFNDDDTRTINVPDPRNDLTDNDLKTLSSWIAENGVVIGDKAGAPVTGIKKAQVVDKRDLKFDLKN